mgnify:CR=1 FL=1
MKKDRILVVEDDEDSAQVLMAYLNREGFEALHVADGMAALAEHARWHPDLILLDVMLPKRDGFSVCRALRTALDVPILMITARGEDYDRIMGLDTGADDYIVKPFSAAEVMARVRAVLRRLERSAAPATRTLVRGSLTLLLDEERALIAGHAIILTKKEFDILCLLAENKSRVFSRDHLLESLWGYDYEGDTRTVDTHIKRLRAKLAKVPHSDWEIRTVWGVGYAFEVIP